MPLDRPAPSEMQLRGSFGPIGLDFSAQVAPTWVPGPARIAIPLESGIELHKTHFSNKIMKNRARGPQVEAKTVSKLVKGFLGSSTEPQSAPKCSPGRSYFPTFRHILHDLVPPSPKAASGNEFSAQNDPADSQNHENIYMWIRRMSQTGSNNGRFLTTFSNDLGPAATCSGPLALIHLSMVTTIPSDPLYYMMIRRRNNKSIYIYIYIFICMLLLSPAHCIH